MKKNKYAVVMLCTALLGTFTTTALATEKSKTTPELSTPKLSNTDQNTSKTTPSSTPEKNGSENLESTTKQKSTDEKVNSDEATDKDEEQFNHKMGTYAKSGGSGRPELRAEGVPTIYSNDSSLPRRDVVDIASWQSWMTQNDFNILKSQGVKAICIKLTEGTNYQNPYAASHIQMARNAGLAVSAYHYSRFSSTAAAVAEANYFAQRANALGLPKGTLMVNDAEDSSMNVQVVDATVTSNTFAQQLKNNGFTNVLHYASASWVGIGSFPLEINKMGGIDNFWIAQYDYAKPSSSNLKWQDKGGAWQYSANMILAGGSTSNFLDVSIDYKGRFTGSKGVTITQGAEGSIYRLYNPNNKEHFYTPSFNEAKTLLQSGWGEYEGISWYAPKSGQPVYRLYNKGLKDHHYTMSTNERDTLVAKYGWQNEGLAWYSDSNKKVPIYRAFHPGLISGSHNYTGDSYEQSVLTTQRGWLNEGVAWYGMTAP